MDQPSELARGAVLSLREAATATGVSYSTIKRRQPEFEHAYRDSGGVWRVPVSDLLGAGLHLRGSSVEPVSQAHEPPVNGADQGQSSKDLREHARENRELTAELAAERERRLVAETKVMLLTANLDDLRLAMRAISGPVRPPETVQEASPVVLPRRAVPEPAEAPPAAVRQGFWARLRRS